MRLIDADKLKDEVNSMSPHYLCEWDTMGVLMVIDGQPTIEPPQGEWQLSDMNTHNPKAACSLCGYTDLFNVKGYMKYCPNCGARMTNGGS